MGLVACTFVLSAFKYTSSDSGPPRLKVDQTTTTASMADYFIDYPVPAAEFGEMGRRVQLLTEWIALTENESYLTSSKRSMRNVYPILEKLAVSLFPFLHKPENPHDPSALASLRSTYIPGSRGIIIPTGKGGFRFACHLINNLRHVLKSTLPIQIVYAGDEDLPWQYRRKIVQLGANIETLDILTIFDDTTLQLSKGGWAIKPFAMLGTKYEQVILMDADAVWLQEPSAALDEHAGYQETGTLLFHDRLADRADGRHEWWRKLMVHHKKSKYLENSIAFNEKWAYEGDSGVVVLDKSRLPVLMGLLHICWQNTKAIRDEITYEKTWGDKESYWLGLELSGVPYTFAEHYGGSLGFWNGDAVCGSTIAHVDEKKKLMWYNGSLLKNKGENRHAFRRPDYWMLDGGWSWNWTVEHTACMRDGKVFMTTPEEMEIIEKTINLAESVDEEYANLMQLPKKISEEEYNAARAKQDAERKAQEEKEKAEKERKEKEQKAKEVKEKADREQKAREQKAKEQAEKEKAQPAFPLVEKPAEKAGEKPAGAAEEKPAEPEKPAEKPAEQPAV